MRLGRSPLRMTKLLLLRDNRTRTCFPRSTRARPALGERDWLAEHRMAGRQREHFLGRPSE